MCSINKTIDKCFSNFFFFFEIFCWTFFNFKLSCNEQQITLKFKKDYFIGVKV